MNNKTPIKFLSIFFLMFTFLHCVKEKESYSIGKAELNDGLKELLDKYIKYSNLSKEVKVISVFKNENEFIITGFELSDLTINTLNISNGFASLYKGYYIFVETPTHLFGKSVGVMKIPKFKVKVFSENGLDFSNSTLDIISMWEFQIINKKIDKFNYQFCVLNSKQIKEIKSIKF